MGRAVSSVSQWEESVALSRDPNPTHAVHVTQWSRDTPSGSCAVRGRETEAGNLLKVLVAGSDHPASSFTLSLKPPDVFQ